MADKLGRLEKVDIREIWEHEALDFTPWLADHLNDLGEELLVDFGEDDVEKEVSVGDFNIDIVAKDTDGRTVGAGLLAQYDHRQGDRQGRWG